MKSKTHSVMRKPLEEHIFVMEHCNIHLFQHTCEQYGANLCCPRFQPDITFDFCIAIPKRTSPLGRRPCEAVPQESGFSVRTRTTNHYGVPESKACEHDEAS